MGGGLTFEIYQNVDGWRWQLVANNNEIIAHGESYTAKHNAVAVVELIAQGAATAEVYIEDPE